MKQTVCLEDIASFSKGQQINGDDLIPDGAFDYLNGGIKPSGKWSDYNVCGNSVTISEGGNSSGYVNFMPSPFWCGAHCYYLFDVKGKSRYLYYALKSQQNRIMKIRSGACMPNIKKSDLGRFSFIFDDDEIEQDKVVSVLERVENIISTRQQQIAELDELVKSRFIEMFGDCRTNPMDWTTNQLGDIAKVGSSKRVFVEELKDTGIPFYRGTEVGALAEGKQITPELYITEQHYKELCNASGAPQRGDLLMPSICPDGRIWVVDTDEPFYFKDGRVLWVHEICNSYNPTFLLYTLKDRIMTDYSSIASGTTFAELKIFALKTCNVFDVPLALQEQFAAFVQATDKSKFAVRQALDKTQQLFDSLMQEYFG